jgi:hypothetical protein
MQEDGILNNGKSCGYAFGLQNGSYKGLKTVSHSGSMAGYRTVITRFPDEKFTVIILSNRSDADPSAKGYQVAELFLKDKLDESVKTDSSSTPGPVVSSKSENSAVKADLKEYCGNYYSDELDITYILDIENKTLVSKIGNRRRMTLTIHDKDQFSAKETGALFKFDRKGKKIAGFNLDEGNITNLKFTRVK